jgi:negative regulator of flagellin synthesis FlgM
MVDPVGFGPARPVQGRTNATTNAPPKVPRNDAALVHAPSLPKLLSLATELAQQGPPVDAAKITQIRNAIAMGDYRVDPSLIADAMISYYSGTSR